MKSVKSAIKRVLPRSLVLTYEGYRQRRLARRNRRMTTEQVFTDIYAYNRWGGESGTFCSGDGSHDASIVAPYVAAIRAELGRIGAADMTVVDLGCGDYSVGRELASACGRYIGVDIVRPLIAHNQASFGSASVSFRHANIVEEALPEGDICFVRQVLQHLSNDQIAGVLPKLGKFRWCFITEHHPSPAALLRPNEDKPHGENIRVSRGSGVFLEEPPFALSRAGYRLLLEVPGVAADGSGDPGVIRTYLLTSRDA